MPDSFFLYSFCFYLFSFLYILFFSGEERVKLPLKSNEKGKEKNNSPAKEMVHYSLLLTLLILLGQLEANVLFFSICHRRIWQLCKERGERGAVRMIDCRGVNPSFLTL